MKKLLSREPTPEMVESAEKKLSYDEDWCDIWKALWDASPALPEPGEVERWLRDKKPLRARHGLTGWVLHEEHRKEEAADLIAAQEAQIDRVCDERNKTEAAWLRDREALKKAEADNERLREELRKWEESAKASAWESEMRSQSASDAAIDAEKGGQK